MNIKKLKQIITEKLEEAIECRENTRGCGVYLAENIGSYYLSIGEISTLQEIGELVGVDSKLREYDPYETEEDDKKYNYCGALGEIGRKDSK